MFTTILNVTTSNGTKEVEVSGETAAEVREKITQIITEIFGKNGGNNRELKAVSTLVNLAESDDPNWVALMQLAWDNRWKMWEIWYDDYGDLTERFVSFSATIKAFCNKVLPTE